MATKTIAINPAFFGISKKKPSRRQRKQKPNQLSSLLKPNLKKELINKIKDHKKKTEKIHEISNMNSQIEDIEKKNDLQKSIDYLNIISKKRKEEKKKKRIERRERQKTMKNKIVVPTVNEPPYGCLKKGGSKPTYSQYMKTLKRTNSSKKPTLVLPPKPPPTIEVLERKEKLNKLKETMALPKKETI